MKRESLITNTEKLLFDILQESIKQSEQISLLTESLLNKKEESFNTDVEEFLTKVKPTEMISENLFLVDRDTTLLAHHFPEKDSNDKFNDKFNDNVDNRSEKIGNVRKESETKENEKTNENKKVYSCKYCGGEHDRPLDIANCGKKHKKKG